jgi:hypothetical protein
MGMVMRRQMRATATLPRVNNSLHSIITMRLQEVLAQALVLVSAALVVADMEDRRLALVGR